MISIATQYDEAEQTHKTENVSNKIFVLTKEDQKNIYYNSFVNFCNLTLGSLSLYSLKNLYNKSHHGTQKVLNVEIDGEVTKIIAKGSLPISTYFSDISLILGTVGYFIAEDEIIGGCAAVVGIIGNLIFKAFADDSNSYIQSKFQGSTQQINSNNTNITNINLGKTQDQPQEMHSNDSDNVVAPTILLASGIILAARSLMNDSTPGDYRYKFYTKDGKEELPITLEWHNDDYTLVNEYGETIPVL